VILCRLADYQSDQQLIADIMAILAPSYEMVGTFVLKGITTVVSGVNHELYIIRDGTSRLAAFCSIGYHQIESERYGHIGLTAVREDCKGQGLGVRLWKELFKDCVHKESEIGARIPLYFTTANPLVFEWSTKMLHQPAPTGIGQCGVEGIKHLERLVKLQYPQALWNPEAPYLLRNVATDVRYSILERQRIAEWVNRNSNNFLNTVCFDEQKGDRILVVGYAPKLLS
jgi:GNAT superfamily N-acetyltransferase